MVPKNEVRALLERISKSKSFGPGSTYTRLLHFLVDSTFSGDVPKEQTIAEHLFGKNIAGSDTSKIRVYIYHLRKKLQQYFEEEGKDESILLKIPKGGYKVEFKSRDLQRTGISQKRSKSSLVAPMGTLLLVSLLINTYLLIRKDSTEQDSSIPTFWTTYFEDEKPIQVVIGDLMVYSEMDSTTGNMTTIRFPEINSLEQFDTFSARRPDRQLNPLSYSHAPTGSTEWINSLTKIFHPYKDFNIRMSSKLETRDLLDYNLIYVGMQKTAGMLNSYFDQSNFDYDVNHTDQYNYQLQDSFLTFSPHGDPSDKHTDYGFIARYPGPNDNFIFMFSGLWDSAASESLRSFTMESKISEMEDYMKNQLGYIPNYFEMLIEVNGVDRIGFEGRVLIFNEVTR